MNTLTAYRTWTSTKIQPPYVVMIGIVAIFMIFAFILQSPREILEGLFRILISRSVTITDFMEVGGLGGGLMNAAIVGIVSIVICISAKIVPTGFTIAAFFLSIGFAFFGKNLLNMLPLIFGVWLHSKAAKQPFSGYYATALLAASISPITSEMIFLDLSFWYINIALGVFLGALSGFIFPIVSSHTQKIYDGFNLYNMGFVAGMMATFFVAIFVSIGIEIEPAYVVSGGNNLVLGSMLGAITLFLIACGLFFGNGEEIFSDSVNLVKQVGNAPSDFYKLYGGNIFFNMGILCILGTMTVIFIGAELNGPTLAGILTMAGFGAYGKHLKNCIPLIIGAFIATLINTWALYFTPNVLAILFSTALAPFAGKYGVIVGVIVGFLHVNVNHHIGGLYQGLNLYHNGFTAGLVALLMLPIMEGSVTLLNRAKDRLKK